MSEDWGLVTLPTSGDPEKVAIGRLKAASDMALKYYGTPLDGEQETVCGVPTLACLREALHTSL